MSPVFIDFATVEAVLEPRMLVDALREGFCQGCEVPPRQRYTWERSTEADAAFVMMPAWQQDGVMVVKLASIVPGNSDRGQPSVMPIVVVFDAVTGVPATIMDGVAITLNRTAAASALASTYLSRAVSTRLAMLGTGALAPYLIRAHCAVRPIRHVSVWGRNVKKAEFLAGKLGTLGIEVEVVEDAADAVRHADIVSCATLAEEPILRGEWVSAGTHVDLVGSFQPHMREADDDLMARAHIYVDNRETAINEPGDIVLPLQKGVISEADVRGDLFGLTANRIAGRGSDEDITVFKSVGLALEDFVAARLVLEKTREHFSRGNA